MLSASKILVSGPCETALPRWPIIIHWVFAVWLVLSARLRWLCASSVWVQLFEEMRGVERAGILPVGLLFTEDFVETRIHHKNSFVERPLVRASPVSGQPEVYGWETSFHSLPRHGLKLREYNVDMAGFAFRCATPQHALERTPPRRTRLQRLTGKNGVRSLSLLQTPLLIMT